MSDAREKLARLLRKIGQIPRVQADTRRLVSKLLETNAQSEVSKPTLRTWYGSL